MYKTVNHFQILTHVGKTKVFRITFPIAKYCHFVFSQLTLSFHLVQYLSRLQRAVCNSTALFVKVTVSSAYISTNNFKYCSQMSMLKFIKLLPFSSRNVSRSLTYSENKSGDRFSPCLAPTWLLKYSDWFPPENVPDFYVFIHVLNNAKNFTSESLVNKLCP